MIHKCKFCKKELKLINNKWHHAAYFGKKCPIMPMIATARQGYTITATASAKDGAFYLIH